jgi:hypothetical protein
MDGGPIVKSHDSTTGQGVSMIRYAICAVGMLMMFSSYSIAQSPREGVCPAGYYLEMLDAAFAKVFHPQDSDLVIRIMPAFEPEEEFVVRYKGVAATVTHFRLAEPLSRSMAHVPAAPTRENCLKFAQSSAIESTTTSVPRSIAKGLLTQLDAIDLSEDHCVQNHRRECVKTLDADQYEVRLISRRIRMIVTDTSGTDFISENAGLLDWVLSATAKLK